MTHVDRVTVDPGQMGGVPCLRGLRIPSVHRPSPSGGRTCRKGDPPACHPDLQAEDIRECLRYAAAATMERELPLPYSRDGGKVDWSDAWSEEDMADAQRASLSRFEPQERAGV